MQFHGRIRRRNNDVFSRSYVETRDRQMQIAFHAFNTLLIVKIPFYNANWISIRTSIIKKIPKSISLSFQVCEGDFKVLDDCVKKIVKDKQPFERLTMKKKDLLEMFKYNEFKLRILNEKVGEETTVYRCGPLIDLCRGPHVRHTGKVKAMAITKNSATYWEGNSEAESLQRIYGISFPDNKLLKVRLSSMSV